MAKYFSSVRNALSTRVLTGLWGVLVAALVATTLGGLAPAADAATTGSSTFPVAVSGSGTGQVPLATATRSGGGFVFNVAALDVKPSTLTSAIQYVLVDYQLQAWGGTTNGWRTVAQNHPGSSLSTWVEDPDDPDGGFAEVSAANQLSANTFSGTWSPDARARQAAYRVVVTITWYVKAGMQQLGSVTLTPSVLGDLACRGTDTAKCSVTMATGEPAIELRS